MASIEIGVRQSPAEADPEQLAHVRNREDAPLLAALLRQVNLLGGNTVNVSADYTQTPKDRILVVDTSGGEITIQMLDAADHQDRYISIRRSGGSNVNVLNSDGSTLLTLTLDTYTYHYVGHDGEWLLIGR